LTQAHSDLRTTASIYTHVLPQLKKDSIIKIKEAIKIDTAAD